MVHAAHLVLSHLLSVVSFLLAVVLVARAARQRRPTGSTIAWVLAILLIPYVGVPLYLVFGGRKLKARAASKRGLAVAAPPAPALLSSESTSTSALVHREATSPLARMLCAVGASAPTRTNRFELLPTGEASFAAVIDAISAAERTIHVSTLILADDPVGREIALRLIDAAKRGVEVRLMIDALFEFRSSRSQIAELRAAGVRVAWFMPLGIFSRHRSANLRLHRKAILVDDRLAIVGGMNLAEEYMGPKPLPGRWRDLSARVTGPAVEDIASIFRADWAFAAGETLASPDRTHARSGARHETEGDVDIQVVGSGPDVESDRIYDAILMCVFAAKRRLWIATPYFVPDETLQRALVLAVRRGVDVCILVPLTSNHRTADLAGASFLRDLEHAGARIRRYEPGMMHAKLLIADDELAILGSANMDMRSFFLDYELALVVTTAPEVAAMADWFETLLPRSVDSPVSGKAQELVESVARLLAPLE